MPNPDPYHARLRRKRRLVLALQQTAQQVLAWSQWRRWHQAWAKYYHYKRHGASVPQLQL